MKTDTKLATAAAVGAVFLLAGGVSAAGQSKEKSSIDPATLDVSRATPAGFGTDASLDALGARAGVHAVPSDKGSGYGFSSGISRERGSFRLGVLSADFQAAAQAGDQARTKATAMALATGLATLDAPPALLQSATNLVAAVQRGVSLQAVAELARPLLLPQIKAFVQAEGALTFFYLGEWTEALYLTTAVAAQEGASGSVPVEMAAQAGPFAKEIAKAEGTPPGAAKALEEIGAVATVKAPGSRELQSLQRATEALKGLLG